MEQAGFDGPVVDRHCYGIAPVSMHEVVMAAADAAMLLSGSFKGTYELLWSNRGELVAHPLTATRS